MQVITIKARGSNLPYLLKCPLHYTERCRVDELGNSTSNAAADTGNIFHALAAAHHKKQSPTVALKLAVTKYPLGDPKAALAMYEDYKSYAPKGAVSVEECLTLEINQQVAHEAGKLQQYRFLFSGTIDLVCHADSREAAKIEAKTYKQKIEKGVKYVVIDHKTGRPGGDTMITDHWAQLTIYAAIIETVSGVAPDVRINHVRTKTMWDVPLTKTSSEATMAEITARLIDIQRRRVPATPGTGCTYCNLRFPRCAGGGNVPDANATKARVMKPLFG